LAAKVGRQQQFNYEQKVSIGTFSAHVACFGRKKEKKPNRNEPNRKNAGHMERILYVP